MKCEADHENMATPFCPICGHKRLKGGLFNLLAHCRTQARAETTLADGLRLKKGYRAEPEYWERMAERADRRVKKWTEWADLLEALLASKAAPEE